MDLNIWNDLADKDKEQFRNTINTFYNQTFILERKINPYKGSLENNSMYRFIERNQTMLRDYLAMAGWEMVEDSSNGVFFIKSDFNSNYVRFDKITTMFFLVLRLIYEEKKSIASINNQVFVTIKELNEKMATLQLITKAYPSTTKDGLKKLKKYMLVDRANGGAWDDASTSLIIYPSIIHLIDNSILLSVLKDFVSNDANEDEQIDMEIAINEGDSEEEAAE